MNDVNIIILTMWFEFRMSELQYRFPPGALRKAKKNGFFETQCICSPCSHALLQVLSVALSELLVGGLGLHG